MAIVSPSTTYDDHRAKIGFVKQDPDPISYSILKCSNLISWSILTWFDLISCSIFTWCDLVS